MIHNKEIHDMLSLIERIEHRDDLLTERMFSGKAGSATYNPGLMDRSFDNGIGKEDGIWNEQVYAFLGNQNNYFGEVTRLAQQNNTTYPALIEDIYRRIQSFLTNGYFGKEREVVTAVQEFLRLLAYMRGTYEAAMAKALNKINDSIIREGVMDWLRNQKDRLVYKDQNQYGIKQRVKYNDREGNQVTDYKGQWITDLRNELTQMLQFRYLHGPKTVEATKCFIQFLVVDKRSLFAKKSALLKKMRLALVGVAALATLATTMCGTGGNTMPGQQMQNQPQTTQVQQQSQQYNANFARNSYQMSQQDIQSLAQLGQQGGTYKIIVHELANPSGRDASYENKLVQARAGAIQNALGNKVMTTVERGQNVQGQNAVVEIIRVS